jgi:hypothetical protein
MKWLQVRKQDYDKLYNEVLYKPFAGGVLLNGGHFTEWTPHSAEGPRYPDLRTESKPGEETRYFIYWEGTDIRD